MGLLGSLFGKKQSKKAANSAAQNTANVVSANQQPSAVEVGNLTEEQAQVKLNLGADYLAEIKIIENKPIQARNAEENCVLAGYYIHIAPLLTAPEKDFKLRTALELFMRHANSLHESAIWNYHVALCLCLLEEYGEGLGYALKAQDDVEFHDDAMTLIDACQTKLQMPKLKQSFLQGCARSYALISKDAPTLATTIKEQFESKKGITHELYQKFSELLGPAFVRTAFNLDVDPKSGKSRIVLLPVGNLARAVMMRHYQVHAPTSITEHISIVIGRQRNEDFFLKFHKTKLKAEQVSCYLVKLTDTVKAEGSDESTEVVTGYKLYMHTPMLKNYLKEDFYNCYKIYLDLFCSAIGEVPALVNHMSFDPLYTLNPPEDVDSKYNKPFPLSKLFQKLTAMGANLDEGVNQENLDKLLANSFTSYDYSAQAQVLPEFKSDDEHADSDKAANNEVNGSDDSAQASSQQPITLDSLQSPYRNDITVGSSRCFQLLNEYRSNEYRLCDELEERGAAAIFIALDAKLFKAQDGKAAQIDFKRFIEQMNVSLSTNLAGLNVPLNVGAKADEGKSDGSDASAAAADALDDKSIGFMVGHAQGLSCYYVDIITWDLEELSERAFKVLAPYGVHDLTLGTFRGIVPAITLYKQLV